MTDLKVLQIETTNLCNSHCVFCVHNEFKEFGTMDDSLFEKILNDAKEIETLEYVIPMLTGEPFMDKKILQKLKLINKILPGKKIHLYTNGSLLTPEIINELSSIENLTMFFSLNGNAETRKELMGLDDYEYVASMIRLYDLTKKPYKVLFVFYPAVARTNVENFVRTWKDKANVLIYGNFLGRKYKAFGTTKCTRATSHMTVLWNGKVNLCCFDAFGEVIFGDLNNQTIKEVWNSEKRQSFATAHLEGKIIKPCDKCFHKG